MSPFFVFLIIRSWGAWFLSWQGLPWSLPEVVLLVQLWILPLSVSSPLRRTYPAKNMQRPKRQSRNNLKSERKRRRDILAGSSSMLFPAVGVGVDRGREEVAVQGSWSFVQRPSSSRWGPTGWNWSKGSSLSSEVLNIDKLPVLPFGYWMTGSNNIQWMENYNTNPEWSVMAILGLVDLFGVPSIISLTWWVQFQQT